MWGWLVFGLSGFIHISTANRSNKTLSYVFKPVTMLCLLMILFFSGSGKPQFVWVAMGLCLSLFTDLLSLLPKRHNRIMFSSLLLAFLFYSKGFWALLAGDIAWWLPALLFAGGVILFLLLLPVLDTLIFPVSIMGLVLVQMSWAASAVWMGNATLANLLACIACLIFVGTCLLHAMSHYRSPLNHSELCVTGGYFAAQSLIVASVVL